MGVDCAKGFDPMKILLADDHDLVRETLAAFLLAEGLGEVHSARTFDEALSLLNQRFDLVLEQAFRPSDGLARLRAGGFDAAAMQPWYRTRRWRPWSALRRALRRLRDSLLRR